MPFKTDDLRIRGIHELAPPSHLIREFPCSEKASTTVYGGREAIHRVLHGMDDRLVVVVGPCSIHDVQAALEYAGRLRRAAPPRSSADLVHRDARLLREAAHHRRLEGAHQRPRPRRQLRHQPRPAPGARAAARRGRAGAAGRVRVPRHDHAPVHRRPGGLGRHRRAHHREPGAPRAGLAASPCRWASRTAPTATSRSPSTPCGGRASPTTSCRSPRGASSAIVATNGNDDCHIILRGGREAPTTTRRASSAACQAIGRAGLPAACDDRRQPRQQRQGAASASCEVCAEIAGRSPPATSASSA